MPNIPPIVAAALGITDNFSSEDLLPFLLDIVHGLLRLGIKVVSYAADGTGTERSLQRLFLDTATSVRSHIIHHPNNSRGRDIDLRIGRFGVQQQPIAMVQDPPHLRKTLRNNSYLGARLLTLGNYPVLYSYFREVAWADDGTVEALEDPDKRFAVGVLWHPEAGEDRALFDALVEQARVYRQEKRSAYA